MWLLSLLLLLLLKLEPFIHLSLKHTLPTSPLDSLLHMKAPRRPRGSAQNLPNHSALGNRCMIFSQNRRQPEKRVKKYLFGPFEIFVFPTFCPPSLAGIVFLLLLLLLPGTLPSIAHRDRDVGSNWFITKPSVALINSLEVFVWHVPVWSGIGVKKEENYELLATKIGLRPGIFLFARAELTIYFYAIFAPE